MLIVPPGLYFSIYLTFAIHHDKSEQSKLGENSESNLKSFFELFDLALYMFLYLTSHFITRNANRHFFPSIH